MLQGNLHFISYKNFQIHEKNPINTNVPCLWKNRKNRVIMKFQKSIRL